MSTSTVQDRTGAQVAGKYRVVTAIGQGGMGTVYLARHTWTDREVALKIFGRGGPQDVARMLLEGRAPARLRHPHVVDVLDMGEDGDGTGYLAMEYLAGRSLRGLLDDQRALSAEETLRLLLPIFGAVAAAHDAGIVHRDIKPSNILIATNAVGEPVPKLLDFGIARCIEDGSSPPIREVLGTPAYMAPEQVTGAAASPSADVWALGVVVYECLSGTAPFTGDGSTGILRNIVSGRAPRLTGCISQRALAVAVDRALERDRAARYRDVRTFARALLYAAAADGVTVPCAPDPVGLPDWPAWLSEVKAVERTADRLRYLGPVAPARERTDDASRDGTRAVQGASADRRERPRMPWLLFVLLGAACLWSWLHATLDGSRVQPPQGVARSASRSATPGVRGTETTEGLPRVALATPPTSHSPPRDGARSAEGRPERSARQRVSAQFAAAPASGAPAAMNPPLIEEW